MCEAAEVVGKALGENVLVHPLYEVAVFQGVTGHLVDERSDRSRGVFGHEDDRCLGLAMCFGSYQGARWVGVAGAL